MAVIQIENAINAMLVPQLSLQKWLMMISGGGGVCGGDDGDDDDNDIDWKY